MVIGTNGKLADGETNVVACIFGRMLFEAGCGC